MSLSINIESIKPFYVQIESRQVLDVTFYIKEGDNIVSERRLSFPLETSEKTIKTELKKYLRTYTHDQTLAKKSKERSVVLERITEIEENLKKTPIT